MNILKGKFCQFDWCKNDKHPARTKRWDRKSNRSEKGGTGIGRLGNLRGTSEAQSGSKIGLAREDKDNEIETFWVMKLAELASNQRHPHSFIFMSEAILQKSPRLEHSFHIYLFCARSRLISEMKLSLSAQLAWKTLFPIREPSKTIQKTSGREWIAWRKYLWSAWAQAKVCILIHPFAVKNRSDSFEHDNWQTLQNYAKSFQLIQRLTFLHYEVAWDRVGQLRRKFYV